MCARSCFLRRPCLEYPYRETLTATRQSTLDSRGFEVASGGRACPAGRAWKPAAPPRPSPGCVECSCREYLRVSEARGGAVQDEDSPGRRPQTRSRWARAKPPPEAWREGVQPTRHWARVESTGASRQISRLAHAAKPVSATHCTLAAGSPIARSTRIARGECFELRRRGRAYVRCLLN